MVRHLPVFRLAAVVKNNQKIIREERKRREKSSVTWM